MSVPGIGPIKKAGYIDDRYLNEDSCNARPDHTMCQSLHFYDVRASFAWAPIADISLRRTK